MRENSVSLEVEVSRKLDQWFGWNATSAHEFSVLVRSGSKPQVVNELLNHGFTHKELGWVINLRTLRHRVPKRESLTVDEAAKAVRVAKIIAGTEVVFGNTDKANRWMSKPKKSLNGQTPKEAMQDEFGAGLVEQLLLKIDNGFH